MIKIKKDGTPTEDISHFLICHNCSTEFIYQNEDIGTSQESYNNVMKYIQCPYCHDRIYINEKQIVKYCKFHRNEM